MTNLLTHFISIITEYAEYERNYRKFGRNLAKGSSPIEDADRAEHINKTIYEPYRRSRAIFKTIESRVATQREAPAQK